IAVDIASPREYVQVNEIQYLPPGSAPGGKNKLLVQVQTVGSESGPPIPIQLVLSKERIRGLLSVGGGTMQVELPTKRGAPPQTLFAEDIKLREDADDEGYAYLNADGVPRAFVFQVTLARRGDPSTPRSDGRPAVRIPAPPYAISGPGFSFPVEVDNAPAGAILDVSICRLEGGKLESDVSRRFDT